MGVPSESIFAPMESQQLREKLASISGAYDLVAVTLVTGDILLGGKETLPGWDENVLTLIFNMPDGKRYGDAQVIEIPFELIADVEVVPLDGESTPHFPFNDPVIQAFQKIGLPAPHRLPVRDYPNPLATIIYEHNMPLASTYDLNLLEESQKALSTDGIPIGGITFDKDFLLYTDWEFFARQIGGATSVSLSLGPASANKSLAQSVQQRAFEVLRQPITETARRITAVSIGEYTRLKGCLFVPEPPQTTIIEGEEWHLYKIMESREAGSAYAVLLKVKDLKYPLEFLNRVNSVLTFYGELAPIPVNILGENFDKCLLTRAAAYLA
jgi:hypothetical protein